jgi:NAD(P)-dependent dehydrogenase (short-subunit alcohol dehydrogenase family)
LSGRRRAWDPDGPDQLGSPVGRQRLRPRPGPADEARAIRPPKGAGVFDLSGKTVVVTGGGQGIGRGIVQSMAQAGGNVVIAGRTAATLEESAAVAREHGVQAWPVVTDLTQPGDIDRLVAAALELGGTIDCWVNNAGSARNEDVGPLMTLREDQWDAVVDLNLKWTFFACQAAARVMQDNGGGSIINISSRSGSQPCPMTGQYGAAKAGVENLTATMAVEWGHLGIRVNAVAPGVVVTPEHLTSGSMKTEGRRRRQIESVPLRRLGTVEDVGPLCVFLAADESSWITGDVIQVTGGSRIPVGYLTYMYRITQQLAEQDASSNGSQQKGAEQPA